MDNEKIKEYKWKERQKEYILNGWRKGKRINHQIKINIWMEEINVDDNTKISIIG